MDFGYQCQECGKGIVVKTVMAQYRTKVNGQMFIVENAAVGVCDRCGAEHFDPGETIRWRMMFNSRRGSAQDANTRQQAATVDAHVLFAWENEGGR